MLGGWSVTHCSSALKQATDKLYTVVERRQIGHEDPAITNLIFNLLIVNLLIVNLLIN